MGRACSTYGRAEWFIQDFSGETWPLRRPRDRWGIILKWVLEKWDEVMDWIDVAQDRDRWRALVNAVMNLLVPKNAENFLSSCQLLRKVSSAWSSFVRWDVQVGETVTNFSYGFDILRQLLIAAVNTLRNGPNYEALAALALFDMLMIETCLVFIDYYIIKTDWF